MEMEMGGVGGWRLWGAATSTCPLARRGNQGSGRRGDLPTALQASAAWEVVLNHGEGTVASSCSPAGQTSPRGQGQGVAHSTPAPSARHTRQALVPGRQFRRVI